ncbi:BnaC08g46590D [Brassica napus]|uniref:BnaC08g46590D protein n=1 Tax=Brassica napus TaxID=3708 RepID=A0A078JDK2_BRANA|nr:BnaC08g46590D [Brassica napus]
MIRSINSIIRAFILRTSGLWVGGSSAIPFSLICTIELASTIGAITTLDCITGTVLIPSLDPQVSSVFRWLREKKTVMMKMMILCYCNGIRTRTFDISRRGRKSVMMMTSLGAVNTVFAALFSKLGVPMKTFVYATILEEALNVRVSVDPLLLGQTVEKQCAHFYAVTITEVEIISGLVCRVESCSKSKFKVSSPESLPIA